MVVANVRVKLIGPGEGTGNYRQTFIKGSNIETVGYW